MRWRSEDCGPEGAILVVDDDPEALRVTVYFLSDLGFRTLQASGVIEAAELAREHGNDIALLLVDVAMPVMSGLELAQRMRAERPDLPVVFVAGYVSGPVSEEKRTRFLRKPFSKGELASQLREALGPSVAEASG